MGLGVKLVRDTLALASTEYVEMSAVMAKYNPFAEKAGMCKVAEQRQSKEALQVVAVLKELGFNIELISSRTYVVSKLQSLSNGDIERVRQAFIKFKHVRFMKSFSCHMPFGKKEDYQKKIMKASLEKLTDLIRICGFLMQTKVYLFCRISTCKSAERRTKPHRKTQPHTHHNTVCAENLGGRG
jgi:hypothetical protein